MRVIRLFILTLLCFALLSGCAATREQLNAIRERALTDMEGYDRPVNMNDVRQMRQLDRTMLDDRELVAYVNDIRARLEEAHGVPCKCVVMVDTFGGYEAYTLSRNTIVVSAGVIAQATSEDEIAAVIAHELGHVYDGDSLDGWMQDAAVTLVKLAGFAAGEGQYTTLLGEVVDDAAKGLVYYRWNADQEAAADRFATDIILKAGYSLHGQKMAIRRLVAYSESALASKKQSDATQGCLEDGEIDVIACSKFLTRPTRSVYAEPQQRFEGVMKAAWEAEPEARRRRPGAPPPRFAAVDYLFELNSLVAGDLAQLKRALARIERRPMPAALENNSAVNNKLAVAHLQAGNQQRGSEYLRKSLESSRRTAFTFNLLLKEADRSGDREYVKETLAAMHEEVGAMDALLPVEYYLSKRYKLTINTAKAYARCAAKLVGDVKVYNLCAEFDKFIERGTAASW